MSRLTDIPVRIEPLGSATGRHANAAAMTAVTPSINGLGDGVTAILCELANLLERLATADETACIDLRSLPMSAPDRLALQALLGAGEVEATVNAEGLSMLRETRVAGVWWIEHRDRHGELIAELLEVARVPQILLAASDEIAAAALSLRTRAAHA